MAAVLLFVIFACRCQSPSSPPRRQKKRSLEEDGDRPLLHVKKVYNRADHFYVLSFATAILRSQDVRAYCLSYCCLCPRLPSPTTLFELYLDSKLPTTTHLELFKLSPTDLSFERLPTGILSFALRFIATAAGGF